MSVTDWGTITIGRLTLREVFELDADIDAGTGQRTMAIQGQESNPPLTMAELRARQEDILGLRNRFVQITFTHKPDHDGFYVVTDASAGQVNWTGEVAVVPWSIRATYIGPANAVDVESRVTQVIRSNVYGQTGEFWHAPAASSTSYFTGVAAAPSGAVVRVAEDSNVTVWRDIPATTNPRWEVSLGDYPLGRSRVIVNDAERVPVNLTIASSATWSQENGLVQVTPGGSGYTLSVASWGGAAWEDKDWELLVGAELLSGTDVKAVTVLRNDFEVTTVRMLWDGNPGRHTVDLSLRRGSRFVEGYFQTTSADTLSILRDSNEAGTSPASAAYVTATADDADGNRYIVGSGKMFTANTVTGGIAASAVTALDFFIGSVVGGSGAQTGDQAADLRDQYIGVMPETTRGVRR
jgi:hypothetical protein